jgi:hypothetical protein
MSAAAGSRGEATTLRRIAAVGTAISAVVHGYLFLDGWSIVPVVGALFGVNAVTGAIIAVALIASAHWVWRFLAVAFNALSLLALALSHTPGGLFGLRESYWDIWQVMALVSESVGLAAAAVALFAWWRARR